MSTSKILTSTAKDETRPSRNPESLTDILSVPDQLECNESKEYSDFLDQPAHVSSSDTHCFNSPSYSSCHTFSEIYRSYSLKIIFSDPFRAIIYSPQGYYMSQLKSDSLKGCLFLAKKTVDSIVSRIKTSKKFRRHQLQVDRDLKTYDATLARKRERFVKSSLFDADDGFGFSRHDVDSLPLETPKLYRQNARTKRAESRMIKTEMSFESIQGAAIQMSQLTDSFSTDLFESLNISPEITKILDMLIPLHDAVLFVYGVYKATTYFQILHAVRGCSKKGLPRLTLDYAHATVIFGIKQLMTTAAKPNDTIKVEGFFETAKTVAGKRPSDYLKWFIDSASLMFSSDFAKLLHDAMICALSLNVFGTLPSKEVLRTIQITKKDLDLSGLDISLMVARTFTKFLALAENFTLGELKSSYFLSRNPVMVALANAPILIKQSECLSLGLPVEGYRDIPSWYQEAEECYKIIESASKKATPFTHKGTEILKFQVDLGKCLSDVRSRMASERRAPPIGVVLTSYPGVGKSGLINFICAVMSHVRGRDHSDKMIYHRNMASDYMESLQACSQPYYHYSELGKWKKELAAMKDDKGVEEFLSLCDSQPMEVNKAFGDKGKSFAAPEIVIGDTNNTYFNVDTLCYAPAATKRRFWFLSCEVMPQFAKDGSCEIDYNKGKDAPLLDKWYFNLWKEDAINNTVSAAPKYAVKRGTIHDLFDALVDIFSSHIKNTLEFEDKLSQELKVMHFGKNRPAHSDVDNLTEITEFEVPRPDDFDTEDEYESKSNQDISDYELQSYSDLSEADYPVIAAECAYDTCDECKASDTGFVGYDFPVHVPLDEKIETIDDYVQSRRSKSPIFSEDYIRAEIRTLDALKKKVPVKPKQPFIRETVDKVGMQCLIWGSTLFKLGKQTSIVSVDVTKVCVTALQFRVATQKYNKNRELYDTAYYVSWFLALCPFLLFGFPAWFRYPVNFMALVYLFFFYTVVRVYRAQYFAIKERHDENLASIHFSFTELRRYFGYQDKDADGIPMETSFESKEIYRLFLVATAFLTAYYATTKLCGYVAPFFYSDKKPAIVPSPPATPSSTPTPEPTPAPVPTPIPSVPAPVAPIQAQASFSKFDNIDALHDVLHAGGQLHSIPINKTVERWNYMKPVMDLQHTSGYEGLFKRIQNNSRLVYIYIDDEFVGRMFIFGVKGDIAFITKHAFAKAASQSVILLKSPISGQELDDKVGYHTIRLCKSDLFDAGTEGYLFRCGSMMQFKDVTGHIVKEIASFSSWLPCRIGNDDVVAEHVTSPRTYSDDSSVWTIEECYRYLWKSHAPGKCGLPLIGNFGSHYGIFSIHFGTSPDGSFSAPLCRNYIDEFEKKTKDDVLFPICSEGDRSATLAHVHQKSPFRWEEFPILHMGTPPVREGSEIPMEANLNKHSSLTPSMIADDVDCIFDDYFPSSKTEYGPPTMKPHTNSKGEWISPYSRGLRKMSTSRKTIDRFLMRRVIKAMVDHIVPALKKEGIQLKPYDIDHAINGDPNNPNFRRMNASTASGYGWKGPKSDHIPIVDENHPYFGVYRKATPELEARVCQVFADWKNGITTDARFSVALKDEARSKEKCENGSTRLFYVQSIDQVIAMRMLFGSFFSLFPSHKELFHCAVGIDMHRDADDLYRDFLNFKGPCGDFDYEGFDVSSSPDVAWMAISAIVEIFKQLGFPPELLPILHACGTNLLSPILVMLTDVFSVCGLQPSGMYATAELNSFKNTMMLMLYWFSHPILQFRDFFKEFFHYTYGDDIFYKICMKLKEYFDNRQYAKFCKEVIGMSVTTASKSKDMPQYTPVDELTFLKRSFVYRNDLNRYVASLESDSIRKSLKWYLPSKVDPHPEQMLSTIRSALYEVFFHLREEEFFVFRKRIAEVYLSKLPVMDIDIRKKVLAALPTFEDIKASVCESVGGPPIL